MLAFKLMDDQYGVLTFCRIIPANSRRAWPSSIQRGKDRNVSGAWCSCMPTPAKRFAEAYAGDIVALVGLKDTRTGDTLCDPSKPVILREDGLSRFRH